MARAAEGKKRNTRRSTASEEKGHIDGRTAHEWADLIVEAYPESSDPNPVLDHRAVMDAIAHESRLADGIPPAEILEAAKRVDTRNGVRWLRKWAGERLYAVSIEGKRDREAKRRRAGAFAKRQSDLQALEYAIGEAEKVVAEAKFESIDPRIAELNRDEIDAIKRRILESWPESLRDGFEFDSSPGARRDTVHAFVELHGAPEWPMSVAQADAELKRLRHRKEDLQRQLKASDEGVAV